MASLGPGTEKIVKIGKVPNGPVADGIVDPKHWESPRIKGMGIFSGLKILLVVGLCQCRRWLVVCPKLESPS